MNEIERVARAICAVEWGNPDHPLKQLQPGDPTVAWEIYVPEATAAIAAMRGEPVAMMGAKEISAAALLAACESDPADPEHPDTICITTGDLETIVRCAVENWAESLPTPPASGKD